MNARYECRKQPFDSFRADRICFYAHVHSQVELLYVREGNIAVHVGTQQKQLIQGDIAVIFPNTVHSYQTIEKSCADLLIFNPELTGELSHLWTKYNPETPFYSIENLHMDVHTALERLVAEKMKDSLYKGYLIVLAGRLFEQMKLLNRTKVADEDLLYKILNYVDDHYKDEISLNILGKSLGASKYQISRCFSHCIGDSLNGYLNALRASYAADLLKNTELTVAQAGYEAGFESLSTFYRAFKTNLGMTPKVYKSSF